MISLKAIMHDLGCQNQNKDSKFLVLLKSHLISKLGINFFQSQNFQVRLTVDIHSF